MYIMNYMENILLPYYLSMHVEINLYLTKLKKIINQLIKNFSIVRIHNFFFFCQKAVLPVTPIFQNKNFNWFF
jgi:hypothetical protein